MIGAVRQAPLTNRFVDPPNAKQLHRARKTAASLGVIGGRGIALQDDGGDAERPSSNPMVRPIGPPPTMVTATRSCGTSATGAVPQKISDDPRSTIRRLEGERVPHAAEHGQGGARNLLRNAPGVQGIDDPVLHRAEHQRACRNIRQASLGIELLRDPRAAGLGFGARAENACSAWLTSSGRWAAVCGEKKSDSNSRRAAGSVSWRWRSA